MRRALIGLYKRVFVRKALYRFHRRLLNIGLWGLGVLNSEDDRLSGEACFLRRVGELVGRPDELVVLDVGANVGRYANRVRQLYPRAAVYAFEPSPEAFRSLSASARAYGYAAFNLAMSDAPGRMPLYDRRGGGTTHASLFREVITAIHDDQDLVEQTAAVSTVDSFAEEHNIRRIHLLKVDTEGSDLNVLLGARRLIAGGSIDVIQFEFNAMNVVSRVFMRDFAALLDGYRLYRMLPDGLVPLDLSPTFLSEIFAFQNIVAVRSAPPS